MKYLKFTKNKQLLAIVLSVLLVGCGMETEQVIKEVDICVKAGFKPVQFINGFTNKTSHVRCDVIYDKSN